MMLAQTSTVQQMDLQSFLAAILAVSVAVERVVEILKQTVGTIPRIGWLFTPAKNANEEAWRCALIHLLSAVIGGVIGYCSNITIPGISNHFIDPAANANQIDIVSCVLIGLLSAGGSAFWNHALDLVKAAKVQKEQTAKVAVATTDGLGGASAVNL